jgi:hypothetical protein
MFGKKRRRSQAEKRSELANIYLIGAMPVALGMLSKPGARIAAQVFILGMLDMQRQVEGLSMEEFSDVYEFVLDAHGLLPEHPVPEFIDTIAKEAANDQRIGQLWIDGAHSLRAYVAEKDHEAPIDLARAVRYGVANPAVFSGLL